MLQIAEAHLNYSWQISEIIVLWKISLTPRNPSTAMIISLPPNGQKPSLLSVALSLKRDVTYSLRPSTLKLQQRISYTLSCHSTILVGEPIIQSTHNYLRILKQEPGMSIQSWYTLVRLEYQKYNFLEAADDRLQRDIFVIGLNDTLKRFRSDVIYRENFTTLTFAQFISKAPEFEAGLKSESAITQHHLEEAANKATPH